MQLFPQEALIPLSELEKFMLLYLKNHPGERSSVLVNKFRVGRVLLFNVIQGLKKKGFIQEHPGDASLSITDAIMDILLDGDILLNELHVRDSFDTLFDPGRKILYYVVENRYQYALDLYMLNYFEETCRIVRDIFTKLTTELGILIEDWFHETDALFLKVFMNLPVDEHVGFSLDIALDILYKITIRFKKRLEELNDQDLVQNLEKHYQLTLTNERDENTSKKNDSSLIERHMATLFLFFDKKVGPTIFFSSKKIDDMELVKQLKKIMDMFNTSPFNYSMQGITTVNYQFEIPSALARGNKEYLQLTTIFSSLSNENEQIIANLLVSTASDLQMIPDLYKIFYKDQPDCSGLIDKFRKTIHSLDDQIAKLGKK